MREEAFLAKKLLPEMHKEKPVEEAIKRHTKRTGERVPNEPSEKVGTYIDRLNNVFLNPDTRVRERNINLLRKKVHKEFVLEREEFPEAYFELQKRILRERGQAVDEIPVADRERMKDTIIEDQEKKLDEWIDYLGSDDAVYPPWFKYFAFRNITKLSQFDKEREEFKKRSKSTTATFPDIDREALARLCDKYVALAHGETEKFESDEAFKEFAGRKFADLYAEEIARNLESAIERGAGTAGLWKKYKRGDMSQAEELYESLQGKGTGWCTAGKSTAEQQIRQGDFYVYYTYKDKQEEMSGTPSQPRIAIRMAGEEIGEVRGVLPHQELEPLFTDVLKEKLGEFGDKADAYTKKVDDMKRLTALDHAISEGTPLGKDDLEFLYEFKTPIQGFGYQRDPRIEELRGRRNIESDLRTLLEDHTSDERLEAIVRQPDLFLPHPSALEGVNRQEIAAALISSENPTAILNHFDSFKELDQQKLAMDIARTRDAYLVMKHIDRFEKLDRKAFMEDLLAQGRAHLVTHYMPLFTEVNPLQIARRLLRDGVVIPLAEDIQNFPGLTITEILSGVPKDVRLELIERSPEIFLKDIDLDALEIDQTQLLNILLAKGRPATICRNIKSFTKLDKVDVARRIIERNPKDAAEVKNNIAKFGQLPMDVVLHLLDVPYPADLLFSGYLSYLDPNPLFGKPLRPFIPYAVDMHGLSKFSGLHLDIAKELIEEGRGEKVARDIQAFDRDAVPAIRALLERAAQKDGGEKIRFSHFPGISEEERLALIKGSEEEIQNLNWHLMHDRSLEPGMFGKAIARELIQHRNAMGGQVADHIQLFKPEDHDEIARLLMKDHRQGWIVGNLDRFEGLSVSTLERLRSSSNSKEIREKIERKLREAEPNPLFRLLTRVRR